MPASADITYLTPAIMINKARAVECSRSEVTYVPTRRIFELALVVTILSHPAIGLVHLWAKKTLDTQEPGTILHGIAEIVTVLT
jgi:hypothetical protein